MILSFPLYADGVDDNKYDKYFVDYTYLAEFNPNILGIYVLNDDIPIKIMEDSNKMAQILGRYIFLRDDINYRSKIDELLSINFFNKFSQKHFNHFTELRDLDLIKRDNGNNADILYYKINEFITKKKDFYERQYNSHGIAFCDDIEKSFLKPLYKINKSDFSKKEIKHLSKSELKEVWINFKKRNAPLIHKYFINKADKLFTLNDDDTFRIKLNADDLSESRYFYLSVNMLGQTWYLELFDDYVSDLHNITLIKL